jgi:hypothetical protein
VIREKLFGHQIKTQKQFRLIPGAFIISRIQCWHQAYAIVGEFPENAIASSNYDQFAISSEVDTRFFWWLSHSPAFTEAVRASASGVVIEKMVFDRNAWLAKSLRMPPLAEQRRIVARIDELAAHIHEARTLRQQAAEEAETLGATASSKRFRDIKTTKPLSALIADGTTISYGVLVPGPEVEDGIPFIRIQDLVEAPARPSKRISPEIEKAYGRTRLKGGEVLIAVVGATIGKVGVAPDSWRGANIARAVCRIVPSPELDRDFLVYVLRSQGAQEYFHSVTRTLAQPTLNVGQLEQTRIPVPPLAEQRRIVAELDALQAAVDALKRLQAETAAELDALLPSILDRAFNGEL